MGDRLHYFQRRRWARIARHRRVFVLFFRAGLKVNIVLPRWFPSELVGPRRRSIYANRETLLGVNYAGC